MPRCKNVSASEKPSYYTGKENTPRGRGYDARYEEDGKGRKGTDGQMYVAKNGRWIKKKSTRKTSPQGLYDQPRYEVDPERQEILGQLWRVVWAKRVVPGDGDMEILRDYDNEELKEVIIRVTLYGEQGKPLSDYLDQ